jgi:hypothetical protein
MMPVLTTIDERLAGQASRKLRCSFSRGTLPPWALSAGAG